MWMFFALYEVGDGEETSVTDVLNPWGCVSRQPLPNTNRNLTLMEHWNQTVAPEDTVYLDGEFGV